MSQPAIIRIKPNQYIHVKDSNRHVTRVEIGPQIFTRKEHEKIVRQVSAMVMIPPQHFCKIQNPAQFNEDGSVQYDKNGNVVLSYGETEYRTAREPFPLYPGEELIGAVAELTIVPENAAIRIRAVRDFNDGTTDRKAGDEYLFIGPATYIPKIQEEVQQIVRARIVRENTALKLLAARAFFDKVANKKRQPGETWLVRRTGAYLPRVEEIVQDEIGARILTDTSALHLKATADFVDFYGHRRKPGEEWLITNEMADTHIPDVYELVVNAVPKNNLTLRQYCVILNPYDDKEQKPLWGKQKLVVGEAAFFLRPGEKLLDGEIKDIIVLSEEQALLLTALESFKDGEVVRKPGERWLIHGPRDYIPPIEVKVLQKRSIIPLDESEGIYVRDMSTGAVRTENGKSYLLKENESKWEKHLDPIVEELLLQDAARDTRLGKKPVKSSRDKTRVVTYRVPHNAAVQLFDFKNQTHRVVFGPELIMLEPYEEFTRLSLSGGKPKRSGVIPALCLFLGPDFMTDIVTVETSDHARLQLQLAYNWYFDVAKAESRKDIFQVPDFVGDACKAIASRVRGAVASKRFDVFHKQSADIITRAVFGVDSETGEPKKELRMKANSLVITSVDIQTVEPVDSRTQESLQRSVQLAIEITTKAQEATARHESEIDDEKAKGTLVRMKIKHKANAERARTALVRLQSKTATLEAVGQATAEAEGKSQAAKVSGEALIQQAELKAQALTIKKTADLKELEQKREAEISHKKALTKLEIERARRLAEIEAKKFSDTVAALGAETIKAMASAEPDAKAAMLKGLGLKGFMITDGNSPINLFNAAEGLIKDPSS